MKIATKTCVCCNQNKINKHFYSSGSIIWPFLKWFSLLYSLYRENQSLVFFLSESGWGAQLDRENHWPYLLYRETFNFIHWSPFCLRVEVGDRENHWPYLLYRETFNFSPWSPFCLRVEEGAGRVGGPSWTGRTIEPISYIEKHLTLFTVQREPVPGLLSVWEWRWGPGGQGEPLTLSPIQGNL